MQNIHPLFVHFPIALLIASWVLTVVAWRWRRETISRAATVNLVLGALAAIATALTGERAAESATPHSMAIHDIMELHERCGIAVAWASSLLALWAVVRQRAWLMRWRERAIHTFLLTVLVSVLGYGAHLGGRLVYEFGVGTTVPLESGIRIEDHHDHH